jgi:hypothetical protein
MRRTSIFINKQGLAHIVGWLLFVLVAMAQVQTVCAWCISEDGEQAQPGDSHGICTDHAEQMLLEHYQNRFDRTPSYFERFKDGASWEDEEVEE